MTRTLRLLAALLIALLLPIQGFAAACAQICAQAESGRMQQLAAMAMEPPGDESPDAMAHCRGDSDLGAGKCCKAHAFMIDVTFPAVDALESFHERAFFVARWTSFIPEEPSPPPIASPFA